MVLLICPVYGSKADYAAEFASILATIAAMTTIAAVVCFDAWPVPTITPVVLHLPGKEKVQPEPHAAVYTYPETASSAFAVPGHADFRIASAGVAHTRSLTFLKKHLDGPFFDLEKIWDEHTYYEFGDRSVEKTMATMVQEPYVNHVPTVSSHPGVRSVQSKAAS